MTTLPATRRRPVPSESSRHYVTHHDAVYNDPRVTTLTPAARYQGEYSRDEGATWTPLPMPKGWDTVCGGHVQAETAMALLAGWDAVADGPTRIIREGSGALTRWTLASA